MGIALELEPRGSEKLSQREYSLLPGPGVSRRHEALLSICPGMHSAAVRTAIALSRCGEGSGDVVTFPYLTTLHCKLLQPHSNAATSPVLARSVHLGTITPVGRVGAGFVRNRGQLRHSADRQHGRSDDLAGCPPSRTVALLRADGDDWSS